MNKKNIGLLLAGLSVISLMSCSGTAENQEAKLTVISGMERIGQNEQLFGDNKAVIKAARNEYESFQVVVGALEKNIRVVNAEISDLKGSEGTISKNNVILYRPEYVRVGRSTTRAQVPPGLYTDPLIPFINPHTGELIEPPRSYQEYWPGPVITVGHEKFGIPFEVWKGQNQPIWVDIYIPEDASAGEYEGTFTVTLDNYQRSWGELPDTVINKILSIPVTLTVWDFTLPDGPTHRNHFGGVGNIAGRFNVERDSERYNDIEMRYSQIFADHRINPPLPRSLMPEMNEDGSLRIIPERHDALKKFLEELNVTDFEIPRTPIPGITNPHREMLASEKSMVVRYYTDYYRYVVENGWDERAYVYLYDEPNTHECYARVRELGALVREAAPQLKILVVEQPFTQDPSWPHMGSVVDIWCGLFSFIDRDSVNKVIAQGDEVWSYSALAQRSPRYHPRYEELKDMDPPYWHTDALTISYRVPTWLNYQYGITGLLYWSFTTRVKDDWYFPVFRSNVNGDGYAIYPGTPCGIDGPVASIRLKNVRDSMEDYEYLHIYESLAGKDAVMEIVSTVAPNWWETTQDPQTLASARETIANEIMKLKK